MYGWSIHRVRNVNIDMKYSCDSYLLVNTVYETRVMEIFPLAWRCVLFALNLCTYYLLLYSGTI